MFSLCIKANLITLKRFLLIDLSGFGQELQKLGSFATKSSLPLSRLEIVRKLGRIPAHFLILREFDGQGAELPNQD